MDDTIFDHPLTVKICLDPSWTGVTATQGAKQIPSRLVEHDGTPYALIQPRPDRGLVFVRKRVRAARGERLLMANLPLPDTMATHDNLLVRRNVSGAMLCRAETYL